MRKTIVSWSGGKDSCFALQKGIERNYQPVALVTALEATGTYSRSNGVPIDILKAQAERLSIPLYSFRTDWDNYQENLVNALLVCKNTYLADCCIFGDIDIVEHRSFEEMVCNQVGLSAYLPLWGTNRVDVAREEIKSGIRAKLSVIRKDKLPETFIGREYDEALLKMLNAAQDVDPCGENGEFHTIVYNSPLFSRAIDIEVDKTEHLGDVYLSVTGYQINNI